MAQAAVLTESNISTADAQKLATASVAACQAKGYTSAPRSSTAPACFRPSCAPTTPARTVEASRAKAFTSVSAKSPTLAMMENAQKNPGAANLTDIPGFLLLGGGVPVKAGSAVIGAIGVAGARRPPGRGMRRRGAGRERGAVQGRARGQLQPAQIPA